MSEETHAPTSILADTHVHIYPCHDIGRALAAASANFERIGKGRHRLLFLTERYDCHAFRGLQDGSLHSTGRFFISPTGEDNSLKVESPSGDKIFLVAGRQIISAERVEVLALTTDAPIPDGLPLGELVDRVRGEDALPVLSWAPGKWFFKRGRLVRKQISAAQPENLYLGDTTLRPTTWPEPAVMREGSQRGFKILAGSDPLPFEGEEEQVGTYCSFLEGAFDPEHPAASCRTLFRDPAVTIQSAGRRGSTLSVAVRLKRNQAVRTS